MSFVTFLYPVDILNALIAESIKTDVSKIAAKIIAPRANFPFNRKPIQTTAMQSRSILATCSFNVWTKDSSEIKERKAVNAP